MKCSRECIIFSQNNETFEMQVLERGGRILVLEKAGLVCLVQSFASKAKNAAVWDPIFLKSYQTYYIYIYIIQINHIRCISAISISVFPSLVATVPPNSAVALEAAFCGGNSAKATAGINFLKNQEPLMGF